MGVETFEEALDDVLKDVRQVLIARQRKYGHKNIERSGEVGLAVRLGDKLARMENLLAHRRDEVGNFPDESKEDTAIDIAGYGVIWIMWLRDLWGKFPLEER